MNFVARHARTIALASLIGVAGVAIAYQLWNLHRQVKLYARYWSVPRGQPDGVRLVALGDSAAQGIGASSPQRAYVSLIAQRLQREIGRNVLVVNLSASGARLRDVIDTQLPRVHGLQPDIVVVDVGANDIVAGWNPEQFQAQAVTLCDRLAGLNAVVGDVPYFMHGQWEVDSRRAAGMLRRECELRGIKVARLHQALAARGWWGMFNLYAADWFHLNDKGYRLWATAFWKTMRAGPHPTVI